MGGYLSAGPRSWPEVLQNVAAEVRRWNVLVANLQAHGNQQYSYLYSELAATRDNIDRVLQTFSNPPMQHAQRPHTAGAHPRGGHHPQGPGAGHQTPEVLRLQKETRQWQEDFTVKQQEVASLKVEVDKLKALIDVTQASLETEKLKTEKERTEKQALLTRLSKLTSQQLTENNSAITDLSDPDRPMKIGERYRELYDNQWTDAFEALEAYGRDDRTAVDTLRLTLLDVMSFCKSKAALQLSLLDKTIDTMFESRAKLTRSASTLKELIFMQWLTDPSDEASQVKSSIPRQPSQETSRPNIEASSKILMKEVAVSLIPMMQRAYINSRWSDNCIPALRPFIVECVALCWMMCVQQQPMTLVTLSDDDRLATKDSPREQPIAFDTDLYQHYTCSGPYLEYVVWPPMRLTAEGGLVSKGIAQGRKQK